MVDIVYVLMKRMNSLNVCVKNLENLQHWDFVTVDCMKKWNYKEIK